MPACRHSFAGSHLDTDWLRGALIGTVIIYPPGHFLVGAAVDSIGIALICRQNGYERLTGFHFRENLLEALVSSRSVPQLLSSPFSRPLLSPFACACQSRQSLSDMLQKGSAYTYTMSANSTCFKHNTNYH